MHASVTPQREHPVDLRPRTGPENVARDLAAAVGAETASYIAEASNRLLYDYTVLDPPTNPPVLVHGRGPESPAGGWPRGARPRGCHRRYARRQLLVGQAADAPRSFDTGIGNEGYTHQRLQEERSRSDSNDMPFHVLVLEPSDPRTPAARTRGGPRGRATAPGGGPPGPPRSDPARDLRRDRARPHGRGGEPLASRIQSAATERLSRYYGKDAAAEVQSCKYQGRFNGGGGAAQIVAAL